MSWNEWSQLGSSLVSDALRQCGLPCAGLRSVLPVHGLQGAIAGPARIITLALKGQTASEEVDMFAGGLPGDIWVLGGCAAGSLSLWGGGRSQKARAQGAAGAVIDGCYRDVPDLLALKFPVFGRGPTVESSGGIVIAVRIAGQVVIGGRTISDRDVIVGDSSGVVVVPRNRAEEVMVAARRIKELEEREVLAVVNRQT